MLSIDADARNVARCGVNVFVENSSFDLVEYFKSFGRPSKDNRLVFGSPDGTFHPLFVQYAYRNGNVIIEHVHNSEKFDRAVITREEITVAMTFSLMLSRASGVIRQRCKAMENGDELYTKEGQTQDQAIQAVKNQLSNLNRRGHKPGTKRSSNFIMNQASNNDEKWNKKYAELLHFKARNGHCNVPRNGSTLGYWLGTQRNLYLHRNDPDFLTKTKYRGLSVEQIQKLENAGVRWYANHENEIEKEAYDWVCQMFHVMRQELLESDSGRKNLPHGTLDDLVERAKEMFGIDNESFNVSSHNIMRY